MHIRVRWKRPMLPETDFTTSGKYQLQRLRMEPGGLAAFLFDVFKRMFIFESDEQLKRISDFSEVLSATFPKYTRASFVCLMRLLQERVDTDWEALDKLIVFQVLPDNTLSSGLNYGHELMVCEHVLGVRRVPKFAARYKPYGYVGVGDGALGWDQMPGNICLTLRVPRAKLEPFFDSNIDHTGELPVHCCVVDPGNDMFKFAAIQLGFGFHTTRGSRRSEQFQLTIKEDSKGWKAYEDAIVGFNLQPCTPVVKAFHSVLEETWPSLRHFSRTPSMSTLPRNCQITHPQLQSLVLGKKTLSPPNEVNPGTEITFKANLDASNKQIASFTARIDLVSADLKDILSDGCGVKLIHTPPSRYTVSLGDTKQLHITFPVPVVEGSIKTHIARKSSYIELIAPVVSNPATATTAILTYPTLFTNTMPEIPGDPIPVSWNLPRLRLPTLPVVDMSNPAAVVTHYKCLTSIQEEFRLRIKNTIYAIFMQATGVPMEPDWINTDRVPNTKRNFIIPLGPLHNSGAGQFHMILLISCLRVDLGNGTFVLDAALLPGEPDNDVRNLMDKLQSDPSDVAVAQEVDDEELRCWTAIIPALVERCRE
ncbi:hypothetical protein QBC35DRAFT_541284 [Podospora australis]|uniref:Uncharacterized protein n=1 Tax=Podospora australis TaxID=1536484 RepID=A0AAN7AFL2_9PEZI|nr:hypothetical protein QBC35DRAFT_541284 [Podospora australis]